MNKPIKPNACLVSPEWLKENINEKNICILDASIAPIGLTQADLPREYIPASLEFPIENDFSDCSSDLPHMMAGEKVFEKNARKLGINQNSFIIIYDRIGLYSSPRAWWMFKSMGHKEVFVLQGGLPGWKKLGYETSETCRQPVQAGDFKARTEPRAFVSQELVLSAMEKQDVNIIDARAEGRFRGVDPEPRAGLRMGHIPSSINLPFSSFIHENQLISPEEVEKRFASLRINAEQELIFSCGSGLTACVPLLAAYRCGYTKLSVYDGSWSEWGAKKHLPLAKGI